LPVILAPECAIILLLCAGYCPRHRARQAWSAARHSAGVGAGGRPDSSTHASKSSWHCSSQVNLVLVMRQRLRSPNVSVTIPSCVQSSPILSEYAGAVGELRVSPTVCEPGSTACGPVDPWSPTFAALVTPSIRKSNRPSSGPGCTTLNTVNRGRTIVEANSRTPFG
jgi:hypothetical protein